MRKAQGFFTTFQYDIILFINIRVYNKLTATNYIGNGEYGDRSETGDGRLGLTEEEKQELDTLEKQWMALLEKDKEISEKLEAEYGRVSWSEYQKNLVGMRTITETLERTRSEMESLRKRHGEQAEREGKAPSI